MAEKIGEFKDADGTMRDVLASYGMPLAEGGWIKAVDEEKRILTMTGSTEDQDRDGDIIEVRGWQLKRYKINPVFLWAHNYSSVPIGRSQKVRKMNQPTKHLLFDIKFPDGGVFDFADLIFNLYTQKFINASSVGFIPYKWEDLEQDSEGDGPRFWMPRKFKKQELLELSGCPVPSNPYAIQNAIKGTVFGTSERQAHLMSRFLIGGGEKDISELLQAHITEKRDDVLENLGVQELEFEDLTEAKVYQVPDDIKQQAHFAQILEENLESEDGVRQLVVLRREDTGTAFHMIPAPPEDMDFGEGGIEQWLKEAVMMRAGKMAPPDEEIEDFPAETLVADTQLEEKVDNLSGQVSKLIGLVEALPQSVSVSVAETQTEHSSGGDLYEVIMEQGGDKGKENQVQQLTSITESLRKLNQSLQS